MTPGYIVFMTFMTVAFVAMVAGWLRMIFFFKRNKQPEQSSLNPIDGLVLWKRFLTPGGFGPEAENSRKSIVRTYLVAIVSFAAAVVSFFVLPGMPPR